jgi:hypothetical protein
MRNKLADLLTFDIAEQEHIWLNYETEETQIKLDLSDMILEELLNEIVRLIKGTQPQTQAPGC